MTNNNENNTKRPPVVVVMGHIDHGKSTLLDFIRKSKIVEREAGGITQHVGAYEVEVGNDKSKITFLDTPGHEAFCSIREHGSKTADIAVLVVSAEDGVKPQTIEALKCITTENLPYIVAINKIDKPNANVEKIKQELAEKEVYLEGWGGHVPVVAISAKTGQNVDELLELILLQAELLELKSDSSSTASGFVVESNMDSKTGIRATLIVKDGTLLKQTFLATPNAWTVVRMIESSEKKILDNAIASTPIIITGWSEVPMVGSTFKAYESKDKAIEAASCMAKDSKETEEVALDFVVTNLIVRADTHGSMEAIKHELEKLNSEFIEKKVIARIVASGIGAITESDVKNASSSKSIVIGFNVKQDKNAAAISLRDNVEILDFNIIYELTDAIKNKMQQIVPSTEEDMIIGRATVLKKFSQTKDKQVLGCKIESGEAKKGSSLKVLRRDTEIGVGKIKELQSKKEKVGKVSEGEECGMLVESKTEILLGDTLTIFN